MGAFGAPVTMTNVGGLSGDQGGDLQMIAHSSLSVIDHDSNIIPMLAERLPSPEDGTWLVNPSGHSSNIPRAQSRWVGDNAAHWSNPEADRILEQVDRTFRKQEMESLLVQFARLYSDEMPALTLYYTPEVTAVHRNLIGARPRAAGSGANTWNWSCYQWEWV
jgi:ABC-type transport system substrate-binding protein